MHFFAKLYNETTDEEYLVEDYVDAYDEVYYDEDVNDDTESYEWQIRLKLGLYRMALGPEHVSLVPFSVCFLGLSSLQNYENYARI